MFRSCIYFTLLSVFVCSCIGDDFIDDFQAAEVMITDNITSIALGTAYQMTAQYLNNIGAEEIVEQSWSSSNPDVASIDNNGLITAKSKGTTIIKVSIQIGDEPALTDEISLEVSDSTVITSSARSGSIMSTSGYVLQGNFTLEANGNSLDLTFDETYTASDRLPGLYIYLTNNANSNANALEIGKVTTFDGAHSYSIPNVDINEYRFLLYYCKPFSVKVGDGQISQ